MNNVARSPDQLEQAPTSQTLNRRDWGLAVGTVAAALLTKPSSAMGRKAVGGTIRIAIPYDLSVRPFDLDCTMSALIGSAIATPAFRRTASGTPYPSACDDMPVRRGNIAIVKLRRGLRSSSGKPLSAADLVASVERARRGAGQVVLARVATPNVSPNDPLVVEFPNTGTSELAHALASAAVPLLHRSSRDNAPDGTGGFRAHSTTGRLTLVRNPYAVRGPAFLDQVVFTSASSLAGALRSFEAGQSDVGWMGDGLHQRRPGVRSFNAGTFAWVVLHPGNRTHMRSTPGATQSLLNGISIEQMAHLGLRIEKSTGPRLTWNEPTERLLYPAHSAHLRAIAKTLASVLSHGDHRLEPTAVPPHRWRTTKRARDYAFCLDVVRRLGPSQLDMLQALCAADGRWNVPAGLPYARSSRQVGLQLRLGVVGELRAFGAAARGVHLAISNGCLAVDLSETIVRD